MAGQETRLTPLQLMRMAQQIKRGQGVKEAEQLERLAQTSLSEEQREQLHAVMRDKEKMSQLLASPQAQALMQKLRGLDEGE
ncbi:MAG: hypothetical protein FWH26_08430 [Oscillospiraceae bacterium]|nr:hypothetical protein [Oscillospiraceae bacterium]